MGNQRIIHSFQQVGIRKDGATTWNTGANGDAIHGVQTMSLKTNFNLQQVFELGQLAVYDNIEKLPDIEMTLAKLLDGYCPVYLKATQDALTPDLAGRSNAKCLVNVAIFSDVQSAAEGTALSEVYCSGMFVGSVSYKIPLDENMAEDTTLVGNNIIWANDSRIVSGEDINVSFSGQFSQSTADEPKAVSGVNRRQHLILKTPTATTHSSVDVNGAHKDPHCSVIPLEVFGTTSYGVNDLDDNQHAHLSSINLACNFNREAIDELGRVGPYLRAIKFPVEATCDIEVTSVSGTMVSATEGGILATGTDVCLSGGNLTDRTIRIATCEGLRVYLGTKNKLASVNYSGGDTNGSNVTVTYQYKTQNYWTVMHEDDPNIHYDFDDAATWLTST